MKKGMSSKGSCSALCIGSSSICWRGWPFFNGISTKSMLHCVSGYGIFNNYRMLAALLNSELYILLQWRVLYWATLCNLIRRDYCRSWGGTDVDFMFRTSVAADRKPLLCHRYWFVLWCRHVTASKSFVLGRMRREKHKIFFANLSRQVRKIATARGW